jgi:hypothetical protein
MWYLGTTGLPKPNTRYMRVRIFSISLRRIYKQPGINKIYKKISTGSSESLRREN